MIDAVMCEWCGRGFAPDDLGSKSNFCSQTCRAKNLVFHARRGVSEVRNTQVAHIVTNWKALPKSRQKRVEWLQAAAGTLVSKGKSVVSSAAKGREAANVAPQAVNLTPQAVEETGPSEKVGPQAQVSEEQSAAVIGTPWDAPWDTVGHRGTVPLWGEGFTGTVKASNCELGVGEEVHLGSGKSLSVRLTDPGTAVIRVEEPLAAEEHLEGVTGFGMSLYFTEPEAVEDFGLWVFSSNGGRFRWSSSGSSPETLKRGWNDLRFAANATQIPLENPSWGDVEAVQVYVKAAAPTSFSIGAIWAETRPKASLLFIHDGGYTAFDQSPGYKDLLERGVPVTWSIDCELIGDSTHVTRDRLIEVGDENSNSISFHGWSGAISNAYKDGSQAREETRKCQEWIQALPTNGNTGWRWRTAWMQNRSPFSPASDDMVEANPMWDPHNLPPKGATMWPLPHPYNYHRQAIHQLSERTMKEMFAQARKTHGVLVCYTHNVGEGATNIAPERWTQFLHAVDEGVAAGWLEATTFEKLSAQPSV